MIYRHQEILMALLDSPKGLSTADIFKRCTAKPGSELVDTALTSKLIFDMRGRHEFIETSGGLHKITPKGRQVLEMALLNADEADLPQADVAVELPPAPVLPKAPLVFTPHSTESYLDDLLATLKTDVLQFMGDRPVVNRLEEKVAVLEKFANLLAADLREVMLLIIADLRGL